MARATIVDRKATAAEVTAHAAAIRHSASRLGLGGVRVRRDGALVVHSAEPGYRSGTGLSVAASELVGTYVHVTADDVPGAVGAQALTVTSQRVESLPIGG